MKIVLAPDSFKDSMTAAQVCGAMAAGIRRVLPQAELVSIPMADGGEGTVEALVSGRGGRLIETPVRGPLGEERMAFWGLLESAEGTKTAVIEMAAAAGLPLVPEAKRNPLFTTTYGVGQLIVAALEQGCRDFIIGLGGSATNDGGAGMAQALGVRFFNDSGKEITTFMTGGSLAQAVRLDARGLHPAIRQSHFVAACDVRNPLLGRQGATAIYGPQKGADASAQEILERNLAHYIGLVEEAVGLTVRDRPGAGAAGGLGAAVLAWLAARLEPGIDIVIRYSGLAQAMAGADVVLTGEGRVDGSTVFGKTIAGILRVAAEHDIKVVALAGSVGPGFEKCSTWVCTRRFRFVRDRFL